MFVIRRVFFDDCDSRGSNWFSISGCTAAAFDAARSRPVLSRARLGLVQKEEYAWPGRGDITVLAWAGIVNKLKADYPYALKAMDVSR